MKALKPVAAAFVAGGLFSVLGQAVIVLFASIFGADFPLVIPLALIAFGLIGGVLFVAGIYQKIDRIGAYGAILPLCGLSAALAGVFMGAKAETGSNAAAVKAALSFFLSVVGVGAVVSAIIGVVAFYFV